MHRVGNKAAYGPQSLPHAGGDTPGSNPYGNPLSRSAPRRWGYTFGSLVTISAVNVCPTQVGIHLSSSWVVRNRLSLPHAGGDTPGKGIGVLEIYTSAPRRWGYTVGSFYFLSYEHVCPTQVGIHLAEKMDKITLTSLPHAGGDTPLPHPYANLFLPSAPRRWGYTVGSFYFLSYEHVCPTQVGIHLIRKQVGGQTVSLPHAGGDTPEISVTVRVVSESAPRRWGYTGIQALCVGRYTVCPTQVGIHRCLRSFAGRPGGLPHAGGDTPL